MGFGPVGNFLCRFFIDTAIIALVDCFCSEVCLASARLPQNPKIESFFLETSMSNRSKDRSSLCSFTFVEGRHCRIPRQVGHPYISAFHARKEAQSLAGQAAGKDIDSVSAGSTF